MANKHDYLSALASVEHVYIYLALCLAYVVHVNDKVIDAYLNINNKMSYWSGISSSLPMA